MNRTHYLSRIAAALLLLVGLAGVAQAQTRTISGRVLDGAANGTGLPGANVVAKGTATGTVTDASGNFQLSLPEGATTLVISSVGYLAEEVAVGSQTNITVTLVSDVKSLGEVVVIGYGEREKKDLTGSISTVGAKDIEKSIAMQPEMALQGRAAGVFVSTPGGNPNARPQVRIRGVSTFGYAEPLYVIDGVPVVEFGDGQTQGLVGDIRGNVNVLNLINPNDIESMSVLKDASAAAIYGVRAANGVILITTKKGRQGRPKVELSASRGVQNIVKRFSLLNTQQYTALYQEAYANNPAEAATLPAQFNPNSPQYLGGSPTYDWQTPLINRNAAVEDYSIRVGGGSESTTYYVSGGYSRTESPLVQNYLERYSLAANVNTKISKVFSTGLTYRLAYVNALDNTNADLNFGANVSPWQPIYNADGSFAPAISQNFRPNPALRDTLRGRPLVINPIPAFVEDGPRNLLYGPETNSNVLAFQSLRRNDYAMIRNLGTAFFQVEPIQGLRFKGTLSGDWLYNQRNEWSDFNTYLFNQTAPNPYVNNDGTSRGSYGERHSRNFNLVKEFSINFNRTFGADHNVDVLLNAMDQRYTYKFLFASTGQIISRDPRFRNIGGPQAYLGAGSFPDENTLQGYLARVSYKYKDRYYLDATVRRDGSSRFAPGFKWGTFPSVAAAWRITGEEFMSNVPLLNDLKLRAGWGRLGNQETASFAFLSTVSTTPDYSLGSGGGNAIGSVQFGASLPDFPVRDLSWETAETSNIGLDAVMFNQHLSFTVEYYNRTTKDILQRSQLAASVGNQNQPVLNIATVRNSGVELQANYTNKIGEFEFGIGGNLTTVRNRVVRLFRDQPFGGEQDRIEVGQSMFYLWGYKVGGIFQSEEEITQWRNTYSDATNSNNFRPGDMWFQDVNGNPEPGQIRNPIPDSIINLNDRTFLGNTIPGFFYGMNLSAGWRGFDLSVFFQGVGAVSRVNGVRQAGEGSTGSTGVNQWTTVLDRWTPTNPSTTMPRAVRSDPAGNGRFSDRWVENASFMRLRNFQLGYSLPRTLLTKAGFVSSVRLFLSGTNVFTFTRWTGLDPENDVVPPTRSFSLGLNASF